MIKKIKAVVTSEVWGISWQRVHGNFPSRGICICFQKSISCTFNLISFIICIPYCSLNSIEEKMEIKENGEAMIGLGTVFLGYREVT